MYSGTTSAFGPSSTVSFNVGRNIRRQLYTLYGYPLKRDVILNADINIKGLTPERTQVLKTLANIDDDRNVKEVLEDYKQLKYVGIWTCGAIQILMDLDDHVNLSSDAYIRKNISLYVGKKMMEKECHYYINTTTEQTKVCYFLWRIKTTSICKVRQHQLLIKDDFI